MIRPVLHLVVAFIACSAVSFAQSPVTAITNTTSTPIPNVGHDYLGSLSEVVNPANGALSVRIAAPPTKDRGTNWPLYVIMYDTNGQFTLAPTFEDDDRVWNMNKVSYGTNGVCAGSCPPSQAAYSFPGVTHETNIFDSGNVGGPGSPQEFTCQQSTGYIYTDPQGGRHNLGLQLAGSTGNYTNNCSYFGVANIYSGGDEQYKAYIDPTFLNVHIVDEHGDYPLKEDHNGNLVYNSGKAPTASTSSTDPNNYSVTAHYPGTSGNYVETFGTKVLNYTLNLTGIGNCLATTVTPASSNGFAISQLTSLVLPNKQKYTFTYDSTYGTLRQITYPTGAYTIYDWAPNSLAEGQYFGSGPHSDGTAGGCGARYDWPAIQHRTVSYDGKTIALKQDFQYATVWPNTPTTGNWTSKQTTVTTTDYIRGKSYVTVYNYTPTSAVEPNPKPGDGQAYIPQESTILYYNDANKQNLLTTTTKVWTSALRLGAQCETPAGGGTSGIFYTYQPYNWASGLAPTGNGVALLTDLRTEEAEYDYGAVDSACDRPSSAALRDTKTNYWSQPTPYTPLFPASPAILDRPLSVTVAGASGIQVETDYGYDTTTLLSLAPNPPAGHDSRYAANNSTSYPRGNATSITKRCLQQCPDQITGFQYDETGQVRQMSPGLGAPTTYSYTDAYTSDDGTAPANTYIFPTKITRGPFSKTYTWGFNGGTLRAATDANSQTSNFWYTTGGAASSTNDPSYRLTEADAPDGGRTTATYNDQGPTPSIVVSEAMSATTSSTVTTVLDGAGHRIQTQRSDPLGTVLVDMKYDGLGRAYSVSNPYRSTSETTYGVTTRLFDALGRPTDETESDQTSVRSWRYNANTVLSQDESGRQWSRTSDALGRLSSVLEPGASTATPSVKTAYAYDAIGNLIGSVQTGVSGETARSRSFFYNSLSQLITSTNPETGTICYGTWVQGVCQRGYDLNGNLVARTDARVVTATYSYDTLDRLTSKTYSDSTAPVQFSYSETQVWGSENLQNTKNRLSSYTSGTAKTSYTRLLSYDPLGRVATLVDAPPSEAGRTDQHTRFSYDLAGHTTDIWYPREAPTVGPHIQQSWQSDGLIHKVYSTDSGTEEDFLQAATYYADGTPSSISLGNGVVQNISRNNRSQTQSLVASNLFSTASNPLAPSVGGYALMSNSYVYSSSGGLNGCGSSGNNGNILQISDGLNTSWTRQFAYDCINRLSAEKIGSSVTSFAIDSFGNTSPLLNGSTPVYTFDHSTNRVNNLPCSGSLTPFDAAGNQNCDTDTNGANRIYGIDAEERLTSLMVQGSNTPFVQYVYSGEGDRVRKSTATGPYTEYTWDNGRVLSEKHSCCNTSWTDYIYFGGRKIARVDLTKYLLHLHGVRTSANSSCGAEGPASGTGITSGFHIVAGDHLAFDFLQTVASYGGMLLVFTDATNSGTVQDMQTGTALYNDGAKVGSWQHLEGDLTSYAGKYIDHITLGLHQSMPAGTFDMYYANAVIVHADGTVSSINTVEDVTVPAFSGTTCGAQSMTSATENTTITDPAISTTYYLSDHLGTTDAELSGGGWPIWHGHYNAYGQALANAATYNNYKFTGKERDSESGLDFFGNRFYESTVGRWTSPDPSHWSVDFYDPQTWNHYSYVDNNPLSSADANGLWWPQTHNKSYQ